MSFLLRALTETQHASPTLPAMKLAVLVALLALARAARDAVFGILAAQLLRAS